MRVFWAIAAGGLALTNLSSVVKGSPTYPFTTVLNQGDSINGVDPNIDNFGGAVQIVVGNDGSIGTIGQLQNSGNAIVILSTPGGSSYISQSVLEGDTSVPVSGLSGGPQTFAGFNDLAIAPSVSGPGNLTFVATNTALSSGLLQYTEGNNPGNTPNVRNIAFNGQGYYFGSNTYAGTGGFGPIEYQVNQKGDALFLALPNSNATVPEIVLNNGTSNSTAFTPTGTLGVSTVIGNNRLGLASDSLNSGAAVLSNNSVDGAYNIPTGPVPQSLSAGQSLVPGQANILGYSNIAGVNNALILEAAPGNTQKAVLANAASSQTLVSFPAPSGSSRLNGEISPNGKIALYVPGSSPTGDVINYYPGGPVNNPADVFIGESVAGGSSPGLTIQSLQDSNDDYVPMVNNTGQVVFNAFIGTSPANEIQALLSWVPGQQPTVLLAAGDKLPIGSFNSPANLPIIADLQTNNAGFDSDYTRNTLNDSGLVAVGVDYYFASDPSTTYAAVLATQLPSVPEPASVSILALCSTALLKRRRSVQAT